MRREIAALLIFGAATRAAWSADPLTVDVREFGATMDGVADDTAAFQRAFDAIGDGGVVMIPAGVAMLSAPVGLKEKSVTVRGAGPFASRLRWRRPGGFRFSETRTWTETKGALASWEITGIRFETATPEAGTALSLEQQGARLTASVIIRDCQFQPAADGGYWSKSIYVNNGHLGQITGCYFRGGLDPDKTTSHHIHIAGNSTTFMIENCHGQGSVYGVLVEGETEGVTISKCFFVKNAYGYALNVEGGQPMFDISQSHAASCVHALWMRNGRSCSIVGNLFVLRGDPYVKFREEGKPLSVVRIEGETTKDIVFSGNTMQVNDMEYAGPVSGVAVAQGRGVIVADNCFENHSKSEEDSGVAVSPEALEVLEKDNLWHTKAVSGKPD